MRGEVELQIRVGAPTAATTAPGPGAQERAAQVGVEHDAVRVDDGAQREDAGPRARLHHAAARRLGRGGRPLGASTRARSASSASRTSAVSRAAASRRGGLRAERRRTASTDGKPERRWPRATAGRPRAVSARRASRAQPPRKLGLHRSRTRRDDSCASRRRPGPSTALGHAGPAGRRPR